MTKEHCLRCNGRGSVPLGERLTITCPNCEGRGIVYRREG